jgi:hypothetical protein
MGLKELFGYDVRDVWQRVATDIGAEYDAGKQVLLQRPKITLRLGARTVLADIQSPGISGVQDDETWVRAHLESFEPFTFEVRDRTIWASARRLFGKRPPATGCPHVDRRFEASSPNPERMRELLSRPSICPLLEGHRHMVELAIHRVDPSAGNGRERPGHVLRYRELGHVRDGERLKRILLLCAEILAALEGDPALTDGLARRWGIPVDLAENIGTR